LDLGWVIVRLRLVDFGDPACGKQFLIWYYTYSEKNLNRLEQSEMRLAKGIDACLQVLVFCGSLRYEECQVLV
jgi:hypothetical protein